MLSQVNSSISVSDVALPVAAIVTSKPQALLRTAIERMSSKRLGIVCVVDDNDCLIGVLTDGDLRRMLLRDHKPIGALYADDVGDHITRNPKTALPDMLLVDAVALMETADIYDLPVVDAKGKLIGLLHMHTALKFLLGL